MRTLLSLEVDDVWVWDVENCCVSPVVVGIMCGKTKGLSWHCDDLFTAVSIMIWCILCVLQLNIHVTWCEYYFRTNLCPEFERFIAVSLHKIPKSLKKFVEGQFYVATIFRNREESVCLYCGQIKREETNWDAALIYLFSQFVLLLFAHCWLITHGKKKYSYLAGKRVCSVKQFKTE